MDKTRIIVHDRRYLGYLKDYPDAHVITVDKTCTLLYALNKIKTFADSDSGIYRLDILCHGIEHHGELGYGLLICDDNLTLRTVNYLSVIDNLFDVIVIHACGVAHVANWTNGNGYFLMTKIADCTSAMVVASDVFQQHGVAENWGTIYALDWQGSVFAFGYNGDMGVIANPSIYKL